MRRNRQENSTHVSQCASLANQESTPLSNVDNELMWEGILRKFMRGVGASARHQSAAIQGRGCGVRAFGIGMASLMVASLLSGCAILGSGECEHSPVAYSAGNPYECQSGDVWGIGHYCDQYGFLCKPDPCAVGTPHWD